MANEFKIKIPVEASSLNWPLALSDEIANLVLVGKEKAIPGSNGDDFWVEITTPDLVSLVDRLKDNFIID